MKIKFSQMSGNREQMIGTAQLLDGKLICTGGGEKIIDTMLGGRRDKESILRALCLAPAIFISDSLKATQIGE